MTDRDLLHIPIALLLIRHPYAKDFFTILGLPSTARQVTVEAFFASLDQDHIDNLGLIREELGLRLEAFIAQMEKLKSGKAPTLQSITLCGGRDKDGRLENIRLELRPGDVVSVVGPTGSGKSRLLADVECLAQGDTPSGRHLLIDGQAPDESLWLGGEQRLVAQLSQNMNFVMDVSVREFLTLHADSRLVTDSEAAVAQIFSTAVLLAGEPFTLDTPVTALSGGQSRALMIADVACLSASPIVLIDEIENAGVDRRKALDLLVKQEKIVLLATHDPLLALLGQRRLVIRNGGIADIIATSDTERTLLHKLNSFDRKFSELRDRVRHGQRLDFDLDEFLAECIRPAGHSARSNIRT
jgi:ABC-type lipoprotein export system ATPase subunit